MRLRFALAIFAAVVWSQVGYHYLPIGWILIGAAILGILFTVGIEPPRRKHELGRKRRPVGLGSRWRRNHA